MMSQLFPSFFELFVTLCQNMSAHDTQVKLVADTINAKIIEQLQKEDTSRLFLFRKFLEEEVEFQNKGALTRKIML